MKRVGLLVPSSDIVIESDFCRELPENISFHVARMYLESTTAEGEKRMLEEEVKGVARRIRSVKPDLVVFGCTSASALKGLVGEKELAQEIEGIVNCPCITVTRAVIQKVKERGLTKLALITPYEPGLTEKLKETLKGAHIEIPHRADMGYTTDLEIGSVEPEKIKEFVLNHLPETADIDGIFISCTTFRGMEIRENLEEDIGLPVITSNSATLDSILDFFEEVKNR